MGTPRNDTRPTPVSTETELGWTIEEWDRTERHWTELGYIVAPNNAIALVAGRTALCPGTHTVLRATPV